MLYWVLVFMVSLMMLNNVLNFSYRDTVSASCHAVTKFNGNLSVNYVLRSSVVFSAFCVSPNSDCFSSPTNITVSCAGIPINNNNNNKIKRSAEGSNAVLGVIFYSFGGSLHSGVCVCVRARLQIVCHSACTSRYLLLWYHNCCLHVMK